MRRSSRSANVLISFSRSTGRSLYANKTVVSLRRSCPVLFRKYVLINFIAEKERSHDVDVTGRVSATWTHFSRFANATDGVSLGKTVCRLLVESLSPRSFFSKFKATVISASNSVLFMPHGSAYMNSKKEYWRSLGTSDCWGRGRMTLNQQQPMTHSRNGVSTH